MYNILPRWRPPHTYANRYEWRGDPIYRAAMVPQADALKGSFCDVDAFVELKMLMGGTTSTIGISKPSTMPTMDACIAGLARNLDWHTGFHGSVPGNEPVLNLLGITPGDLRDVKPADIAAKLKKGEIELLAIHIAEGKASDAQTRSEFGLLEAGGLVTNRTAVIHGIALTDADFAKMAAAGAALVWSPRSNMVLYGETADVAAALRNKVRVAIGPDWGPTGSDNILDELAFASSLSRTRLGGAISNRQLFEMATRIPAEIARVDKEVGSLAPGLRADLFLLRSPNPDAYTALTQTGASGIGLVLVEGVPVYGDAAYLKALAPRRDRSGHRLRRPQGDQFPGAPPWAARGSHATDRRGARGERHAARAFGGALPMKKILVTGSTGHLGEALVRTLRASGQPVVSLDIAPSPFTDVAASVADREAVRAAMTGVEAVLHAASLHKPNMATHTRQDFVDTNVTGTLVLLEEAAAAGVSTFVYTSTTSVFGHALAPPEGAPAAWITEDEPPAAKNIYGATKAAAEDLCAIFHERAGMHCLVLRTSRFFPRGGRPHPHPRGLRRREREGERVPVPPRGAPGLRRRAPAGARARPGPGIRALHRERDHALHAGRPGGPEAGCARRRPAPCSGVRKRIPPPRLAHVPLDRPRVRERAGAPGPRLGAALRFRPCRGALAGRGGRPQPPFPRGGLEGLPRSKLSCTRLPRKPRNRGPESCSIAVRKIANNAVLRITPKTIDSQGES
jgi:hypothetical protein